MTNNSVGTVSLDLALDNKKFNTLLSKSVNRAVQKASASSNNTIKRASASIQNEVNQVSNNTIKASKGLGGALKKIGTAAIAAFSIQQVVKFSKECINLGSDLAEVQNVVDSTFTSMSDKVDKFAKDAILTYGLSEKVTKQYVGTFGAMAKSFGFNEKAALSMSEKLTGLTGDVASFYNLSSDEAYTKLKSVFTGETESLKDLGVVMTQTALDEFALQKGYGKTTAKMSEQEKVALRYAFVQEKLQTATGDFMRTQDGWANQTRILNLQFESLKAELGQGLISALTPAIKVINKVISKLVQMASTVKTTIQSLFGTQKSSKSDTKKTDSIVNSLNNVGDASTNAANKVADAKKKINRTLAGIDVLNIIGNTDTDTDTSDISGSIDQSAISNAVSSEKSFSNSNKILDQMISKIKQAGSLFKEGFKEGLGDANLSKIKAQSSEIEKSIYSIVTNPKITTASKSLAKTIISSFGSITGSIFSIGISIGENFVSGLSQSLQDEKLFIIEKVTNTFKNLDGIVQSVKDAFKILADVFSTLKEPNGIRITKSLLDSIIIITGNIIDFLTRFAKDMLDIFVTPIVNNIELVKEAFNGLNGDIANIVEANESLFDKLGTTLTEIYDTHLSPFFNSVKTGVTDSLKTFLETWNTYVQPYINIVTKQIKAFYKEYLEPLISEIGSFVGSIIDFVKALYENYLKPKWDWIVNNVFKVLGPLLLTTWNAIKPTLQLFLNLLKNMFSSLKNVVNLFTGILTFDTNKIKKSIQGIVNAIKQPFEYLKQWFVDTKDAILNTIKEMVGVNVKANISNSSSSKKTSPKIPKLASGGYIKPNTPRLALIGDNKTQGEIVTPEGKMHEVVSSELKPILETMLALINVSGSNNNSDSGTIEITAPIYIGQDKLDTAIVKAERRRLIQTGGKW